MLDIDQSIFDQAEQRCRRFWWGDYNPKYSDHWVYKSVCNRPNVSFLKTTFLDNPHISTPEREKVLSYDPSNIINVTNGTADDYNWSVYGLGIRSAPEGIVFKLVTYVDEFPDDCEQVIYGLDFGYTVNPSALVRVGVKGMNLYLQKLLYYPFDNAGSLAPFLIRLVPEQANIWADSADPAMIADLRRMGVRVLAVKKFEGVSEYGIDMLKRFKIHIINDQDFRREQENYKYQVINGIKLNKPVKRYNHLWDATFYACITELRHRFQK